MATNEGRFRFMFVVVAGAAEQLVRDVDIVVTLEREHTSNPVPGTRFEHWHTDEP